MCVCVLQWPVVLKTKDFFQWATYSMLMGESGGSWKTTSLSSRYRAISFCIQVLYRFKTIVASSLQSKHETKYQQHVRMPGLSLHPSHCSAIEVLCSKVEECTLINLLEEGLIKSFKTRTERTEQEFEGWIRVASVGTWLTRWKREINPPRQPLYLWKRQRSSYWELEERITR